MGYVFLNDIWHWVFEHLCYRNIQTYSTHSVSHSLRLLSTSCRLITDLHKQNRAFWILSTAFTSQWVRIKISSASKAPHLNCLLKSRCHNTHSLFKAISYSQIWIFFYIHNAFNSFEFDVDASAAYGMLKLWTSMCLW